MNNGKIERLEYPEWDVSDEWAARLPFSTLSWYRILQYHWNSSFNFQEKCTQYLNDAMRSVNIDIIIDIGASTGGVSAFLASTLKPKKLIAIEADYNNFHILKYTSDMIYSQNEVEVAGVHNAVYYSEKPYMKLLSFETPDDIPQAGEKFLEDLAGFKKQKIIEELNCLPAEIITLEEITKPLDIHHADLIKINVMGAEWNIIENSSFIRDKSGFIILEYYDKTEEEAIEFLEMHLPNHDIVSKLRNSIILKQRMFFGDDASWIKRY
tara:strand:- start:3750 stop:4550 length:801 start_codon:yes stop_codon:yes gene_type:complete